MNLATEAPAEIDTYLIRLQWQRDSLAIQRERASDMAEATRLESQREEATARFHALTAQIKPIQEEINEIEVEYARRGGWTRVWLVPGGHAHRTKACHSLYIDTQIGLCPKDVRGRPMSGATEEEIVDAAASRACTFCYPSAPVDKPTSLMLDSEDAKVVARTEREAKKAAKEAKKAAAAITAPDGSRLSDDYSGYLETESAALQAYTGTMSDLVNTADEVEAMYSGGWRAGKEEFVARLLEALAHKETLRRRAEDPAADAETVDEARERLAPKVTAKIRRDQREWANHHLNPNRVVKK